MLVSVLILGLRFLATGPGLVETYGGADQVVVAVVSTPTPTPITPGAVPGVREGVTPVGSAPSLGPAPLKVLVVVTVAIVVPRGVVPLVAGNGRVRSGTRPALGGRDGLIPRLIRRLLLRCPAI